MPCSISYGKSVFIAFDQLLNALLGGWPDETLSSRAYRWEVDGSRSWPRRLIDRLFWWEDRHCEQSFSSERLGRHLPPEARA